MITVNIVGGPLHDEITCEMPEVGQTMKTDGKTPGQVLDVMLELELIWEIDYSQSTDEEWWNWHMAEVCACLIRAKKAGKTILMDGKLVNNVGDEAEIALTDMIAKCGDIPYIEENALSLFFSSPTAADYE